MIAVRIRRPRHTLAILRAALATARQGWCEMSIPELAKRKRQARQIRLFAQWLRAGKNPDDTGLVGGYRYSKVALRDRLTKFMPLWHSLAEWIPGDTRQQIEAALRPLCGKGVVPVRSRTELCFTARHIDALTTKLDFAADAYVALRSVRRRGRRPSTRSRRMTANEASAKNGGRAWATYSDLARLLKITESAARGRINRIAKKLIDGQDTRDIPDAGPGQKRREYRIAAVWDKIGKLA